MTAAGGEETTSCDRFQSLWRRGLVAGADDQSAEIHRQLLAAYAEPQRFYHNLAHIEHCLKMFDKVQSLMKNPDAVELAIWMHDVVFQPGAADNEAQSVDWYHEKAQPVQQPQLCQRVCKLIMSTLHDGSPLQDEASRYMVDIDLSSFGLPWEEFLRDSLDLRSESQLDDKTYYANQTGFQKSLLARKRFYQSDYFHEHFETQARANLARYFDYVASLDAG